MKVTGSSFGAISARNTLLQRKKPMVPTGNQKDKSEKMTALGLKNESFKSAAKNNAKTKSNDMRDMLRNLEQTPRKQDNPYSVMPQDGASDVLSTKDKKDKTEYKKKFQYNYKEVAGKIRQAKTSSSASQAVVSAKRKVLEIRRKISGSTKEESEELRIALNHAERMEMAARKKKHNLELEELVVHTQRIDDNQDKLKEASENMSNALIDEEETKVSEAEDAVFEEREAVMDDVKEQIENSGTTMSDEMMEELTEMISELGEETLKELEDSMEMLENMEVVDPHMSKEDLDELKVKHRNSENKALMKADMDYLKAMIKYMMTKDNNTAIPSGGGVIQAPSVSPVISFDVSTPEMTMSLEMDAPTVDVSV